MAKEIELDDGQNAIVDDENFEWLNKYKWYAIYIPNIKSYYAGTYIDGKLIFMHDMVIKRAISN